jgi:3-hydroxyisobutyrate dehydrogenase
MSNAKPKIAVLGLGLMGSGMAARLLGKGYAVTVFNRSPGKTEPLRQQGATVASTPRQAAAGANAIISMLADDPAARAVWLGPDGAASGADRGALWIESSTISVDWIRELSKAAGEHGCELLDAPVTGSKAAAAAGELVYLVGGSSAALESARPILGAMSREIIYLGPSGSGALMKLINNFVCGVQAVALAEAVALIERSGLDRPKAVGVLANGAPGSPLVKMISARMMAGDYTPNFMLHLIAKDLRYALQQAGGGMDVAAAALRTFEKAAQAGYGDKDFSSVVEILRHPGKEKA